MKNFETIVNFLYQKFVDTYYVDEEEVAYLKGIIKTECNQGEISNEVANKLIAELDNLYNMYIESVKNNY